LKKEEGGNPVYVALKRIYVTSSPQRIYNELEILAQLRQARCTAYLISAIRHEDQVIAIMPYEKHQDFRVSQLQPAPKVQARTSERRAGSPSQVEQPCAEGAGENYERAERARTVGISFPLAVKDRHKAEPP
jgi:hypothetical protein